MVQALIIVIPLVLAIAGVVLAHWQWKNSTSRALVELELVRADGSLGYEAEKQHDGESPRWQITVRNRGTSSTNILSVRLIVQGGPVISVAGNSEGPDLPRMLDAGHQATWVLHGTHTWPTLKAEWAKGPGEELTRHFFADVQAGNGQRIVTAKDLWRSSDGKKFWPRSLTKKQAKLARQFVELEDEARRLGFIKEDL